MNQTYLLVQYSILNSFGRRENGEMYMPKIDQHHYKMHCNKCDDFFPNIHVFCLRIACTLPVTACETERANGQLKLLRTYLRSTMPEERLSALAIMKIHREKVNLHFLVTDFANQHPRRMYISTS